MKKGRPPKDALFLASLIVISIALDLYWKTTVNLQQAMWACYWASLTVAIGIFFRVDLLVSSGVVFFVGLGVPAWLIGQMIGNPMGPTSLLIHTIPLLAGAFYLRRHTCLAQHAALGAWLLYVIPLFLAWNWCSPDQKINLSHWIWPSVESIFPKSWEFQGVLLAITAITASLARTLVDSILNRNVLRKYRALPIPIMKPTGREE